MMKHAVPVVLAVSFAGCGASPPSEPSSRRLTIVQSSVSLGDPHIVSDSANRLSLFYSIYESLVKLDADGQLPNPRSPSGGPSRTTRVRGRSTSVLG